MQGAELARQSVWWPGLAKRLEELVHNCQECLKAQRQHPQPLTPTPLPQLPWQKVASDLFEWKQTVYLLVVDYYSRYIEIARLSRTTTAEVVSHLKSIFARSLKSSFPTTAPLESSKNSPIPIHHKQSILPASEWGGRESGGHDQGSAQERWRSL